MSNPAGWPFLTAADLKSIAGGYGKADILEQTALALPKTCSTYGIDTEARLRQFLGQIVVESAYFKTTVEYASGWAYDISENPRKARGLGNLDAGDGPKYKGFGEIQETGKANQRVAAAHLGILDEWEDDPSILSRFPYAILSAGYFWQSHGLSRLADGDRGDGSSRNSACSRITRVVNGGTNALAERQAAAGRATHVLSSRLSHSSPNMPMGLLEAPTALGNPSRGMVKAVQAQLTKAGYFPDVVDGVEGPHTAGAVATFQAEKGLDVTGKVADVQDAVYTSGDRDVDTDRSTTTANDLREMGSKTIAAADSATAGAHGALGAGIGLSGLGGLDLLQNLFEKAGAFRDQAGNLTDIFGWAKDNWTIIAVMLVGAGLIFAATKIYAAAKAVVAERVEKHQTGADLSR